MILIEPEIEAQFGRASLSRQRLTKFLSAARKAASLSGAVSVLLMGDAQMRRLNREFRKKDHSTDVLSFPAGGAVGRSRLAGDLAISVETAAREAEARGHSLELELEILLLHGVLHLAGMDHESDAGEMARREAKLRRELGLAEGLIERANGVLPGKKPARRSRKP